METQDNMKHNVKVCYGLSSQETSNYLMFGTGADCPFLGRAGSLKRKNTALKLKKY